ncbi:MAG: acetyl-CoA carboxylase biotin carboxyl carrier protein subunit [Bacteroidales bacterium]|nr:acetyl-CoA carboxylase biotin carboxyl carrier protein subunit [Bacteroidales bacterium]
MSQYKFKINGKEFEVAVNSIENNIASVNVNGVDYSVEINGGLQESTASSGASHSFGPTADAVPPLTKPRVARPLEAVSPAPASATSGKKIVSPLPGVIIDVCVNVGDAVKRGQKIAVIEAMKMENDILAEADGTVTAIYVKKTDSVLEGADIASIA